jgi:hypothetical protein
MSSSSWIFAIAVGAAIVAVANIQYNRARETENKLSMANQALALLQPELQRNYDFLSRQKDSEELSVTIESPFEVAAWQTVSNSDLLLGLSDDKLSNLMQVYYLMNRANILHSKYIDSAFGVASAMTGAKQVRELIDGHLDNIIEELLPILESAIENTSING